MLVGAVGEINMTILIVDVFSIFRNIKMGRPKKRLIYTSMEEKELEKIRHADVDNENYKNPDSLWGKIAIKLFRRNDISLRKRLLIKWKRMNPKAGHLLTSKTKSKHGRTYQVPFWSRRQSYQIPFKKRKMKTKTRKNVSPEVSERELHEENREIEGWL